MAISERVVNYSILISFNVNSDIWLEFLWQFVEISLYVILVLISFDSNYLFFLHMGVVNDCPYAKHHPIRTITLPQRCNELQKLSAYTNDAWAQDSTIPLLSH